MLAILFLFFCNILLTIKLLSNPNCHKEITVQKTSKIVYQKCDPEKDGYFDESSLKLDLALGEYNCNLYKAEKFKRISILFGGYRGSWTNKINKGVTYNGNLFEILQFKLIIQEGLFIGNKDLLLPVSFK